MTRQLATEERTDLPRPPAQWASTVIREQIKILVCFESPVLQAGLMATLSHESDFDCAEGDASVWVHGSGAPDVIVADHCRGMAWVSATAKRADFHSRPRLLIVTYSARECDIRAALAVGVQGYFLVDDATEHLAAAIRAVRPGGRMVSPAVASRLAENVSVEPLTRREEVVLGLVVEGLCNKLIASRLDITAGTVKSHLRSAFGKIGAASRTQAVSIAQRRGLLRLPTAATST